MIFAAYKNHENQGAKNHANFNSNIPDFFEKL